MLDRRRLLAGAAGALATLAGCEGDAADTVRPTSPENSPPRTGVPDTGTAAGETAGAEESDSPTPGLPSELSRADGGVAVDVAGLATTPVTLGGDGLTVRYPDPGARFSPAAVRDGRAVRDERGSDRLRVARVLPGTRPPAVYLAPVFRDGAFEYRAYANAAFVSLSDWYVVAGTGNPLAGGESASRPASFEPYAAGLSLDAVPEGFVPAVAPARPLSVGLIDRPPDRIRDGAAEGLTAVFLFGRSGATPTRTPGTAAGRVPNVRFEFEYDPGTGTVTITHAGGDSVPADRLVVRRGGEQADAAFDGTVSAGDRATVDATVGTTVRVVWRAPDREVTLARFTAP